MRRRFLFSEEKNKLLKKLRGVNFEDITKAIDNNLLDDIEHPSKKYAHHRILIVKFNNYIYAVPYIMTTDGIMFLKTLFPSRVYTKKYLNK